MRPLFTIKKTKGNGRGVFALTDIKKGRHVIRCDLTKLKTYSLEKLKKHPQRRSDHWDEAGRGKWVLDFSPASYVNHSCDPNCLTKYYTLKKKDIVARRDIKSGEEMTVDYSTGAIYGFNKKSHITAGAGIMKCRCNSKKCRKIITDDFFELPKGLQREYFKNLPPSIKRKFVKRPKR
ncbi:MAG: SET domain-containing protein [Patescibacteria group bacterium]